MNKGELINAIAEKAGVTKAKAEKMLNVACAEITEQVSAGNPVKLMGFGAFTRVARAPRVATSFEGQRIEIPACKAVVFTPSAAFKKSLNPPKRKRGRPRKNPV